MVTVKEAASTFLANKRIAVTGVSRNAKGHGSNAVYKRLRGRGYEAFAVNPNADEAHSFIAAHEGTVDLYWIPLGAGGHSVRFNGIVYEAISSVIQRRPRRDIYHSALAIAMPSGSYTIEMTPVPNRRSWERGVVAEGSVGTRWAGRLRIFRYEVRRWCDGVIPDLLYAEAGPLRVADDPVVAQHVLELLPSVPTPTWGRDELRAGEMWSCNSIVSWVLTRAGLDTDGILLPSGGRAPGWDAGIAVARRVAASPVREAA